MNEAAAAVRSSTDKSGALRQAIISAIELEAREAARPMEWQIDHSERHGAVWKVFVAPFEGKGQLDESLEGAAAWWAGPPKGTADVLSVAPEDFQLNLRFASTQPPRSGRIRVYPTRFLDSLAELWAEPMLGRKFISSYHDLSRNNAGRKFNGIAARWFTELRRAQCSAFELPQYPFAYLWGPPGTGKTHTLGALLSTYLCSNPNARILLLSSTNAAVDIALLSVDRCLERLTHQIPAAKTMRSRCRRIGSRFQASQYTGREHLLPNNNADLVRRLAESELARPDPQNAVAYAAWKDAVETLRRQMKAHAALVLAESRLAAMTCTRGVFSYSELCQFAPFDLIVFDEASQIGVAQATPFLSLGSRILFAGDHKQLAPIVCTEDADVSKWLGRSPFAFMFEKQSNACILNEQSRMARDICHVVSCAFYGGSLQLCSKAANNPEWRKERMLKNLPGLGDKAACCVEVQRDGGFHAGFKGFVRFASAEMIPDLVLAALTECGAADIAVLTPFRAQRSLIRSKLRSRGIKGVQVSTVHKAQGSEKHTIFFDPVAGIQKANTELLINVALSRAKARLTILLSKGDLANERLARIKALIETESSDDVAAVELKSLLRDRSQAARACGVKVRHAQKVYIYEGFDKTGAKVLLRCARTGELKKFLTEFILK